MTIDPNDTKESAPTADRDGEDTVFHARQWRRGWPIGVRAALLPVVSAGIAAATAWAAGRMGWALGAEAWAALGAGVGAGIGAALLIYWPESRDRADRRAFIDLIDDVSRLSRRTGFDALLTLSRRHELGELSRAVHRALTAAHADRLQAVTLRRDMDARVARQTKLATAHLTRQSLTDELTGLANRRGFESALAEMVGDALECRDELALLAIDLDKFKQLNDTHGHDIGDEALRAVGEVLGANLRDTDLAARVGGDEFFVVLYGLRAKSAREAAVRLAALVAQHPKGKPLGDAWPTMSIGIALLIGSGAKTVPELRKRADEALYAVKRAGRSAVCVWGDQIVPRAA